ncbi:MAG: ATP-binding protein [Candidatus Muiribacteriota bacterium]
MKLIYRNIILYIIVSSMMVFLLCFLSGNFLQNKFTRRIVNEKKIFLESISYTVRNYVEKQSNYLHALKKVYQNSLSDNDIENMISFHPFIRDLFFVNSQGDIHSSARNNKYNIKFDTDNIFELYISPIFEYNGENVFFSGISYDEDNFIFTMTVLNVDDIYQRLVLPEGDTIVILDNEGKILNLNKSFFNLPSDEHFEELKYSDYIIWENSIYTGRRITGLPWFVIYKTVINEDKFVFGEKISIILSYIMLMGMFLILSYFLIFKKVSKSIEKISKNAGLNTKRKDENKMLVEFIEKNDIKLTSLYEELNSSHNQTIAISQQMSIYGKELEYANKKLRELENVKNNFIASISHELKTPLLVILGYNELILNKKMGDINQEQHKSLEIIKKNLKKLSSLIENMLDYSKLLYEKVELNPSKVDIAYIIERAHEIVRPNIDEKGLMFRNNIEKNRFFVYVDIERMIHLFVNLLLNSIKFTERGGFVETGVQKEKSDCLYVYVKDNGIGIEKDKLDTIFEHFFQVDQSFTRQFSGVGLGLAIVKAIIDNHGGEIFVESQPGVGTTVILSLKKTNLEGQGV